MKEVISYTGAPKPYRLALSDSTKISIEGDGAAEFIVSQGLSPKPLTTDADARMPFGLSDLASMGPFDITHFKLSRVPNSSTLVYQRLAVYPGWPVSKRPEIADDNATFNDEGTSANWWIPANGAISQYGSTLRFTRNGANLAKMTRPVLYPDFFCDFLLYGKMRAKCAEGCSSVLWLNSGAQKVMSLWFGSATANSTCVPGAMSLGGGYGGANTAVQIESNLNYETQDIDFVLWRDTKWSTLSVYFRRQDGGWEFKGRVMCDNFQAPTIELVSGANAPDGNWVEFDHLTICRPNIVAFGDSIQNGASFFSNDPAQGLTNYQSTWMYSAKLYPKLRNNFIVNKGVGGNTSPMMKARTSDVSALRPRLVMIGASSNDADNGISLETRTACMQSMIQDFAAVGAQSIVMNSVNGTAGFWGNVPINAHRDYCQNWWNNGRLLLTGAFGFIDTMLALSDTADRFSLPSLNVADGLHPNIQGYANMGNLYAS